ncbi:MAG: GNAT family N-acetyltransferase [Candidatus Gastranaerophilales bacterium]|nr:GNAT family N-acetyltransferase [Candidatus Gastranaerophilales bacterium]
MVSSTIYEAKSLTKELYKIFAGVYSDFRIAAVDDYKFELEPLSYEDFIDSIEKNLVKCIVLLENQIPTAFLAYTTVISEAIELNVIHCLGDEDLIVKRKILLEKFLEETEEEREEKIVCYPMIGSQGGFVADIVHYGFKLVGLAVLRFMFENSNSDTILHNAILKEKDTDYTIVFWSDEYLEESIPIVHEAFKNTSDALFDTRFKSLEGTRDILKKIVYGTYGEFLPEASSVLLYKEQLCGFCFVNITGGKIANIPIFAIVPEHQGKGLSKHLLKKSLLTLSDWVKSSQRQFKEINTTTETDNYQALKMYRHLGFKEDYCYTQSYLPVE